MIKKKILFATDFTDRDKESLQVACQLADAWDAKLLIVHVNDGSVDATSDALGLSPAEQLKRLVPRNLDTDFEHILLHGDPAREILELEYNRNVVLIILGTHGRKGIRRTLLGSVAEKVLRNADCPVMTLRTLDSATPAHDELTRILLPIDFSVYGYAALDFVAPLAKPLNAEVTILHVDNTSELSTQEETELWNQLKRFELKDKSIPVIHKLMIGDAAQRISEYANSKHFDFVVLGTHGRTGMGRAVMGSVAEDVIRNTNCPVVAVKPSNKRTPIMNR